MNHRRINMFWNPQRDGDSSKIKAGYHAEKKVTDAGAGAVSDWGDWLKETYNLTQPTGANQPTTKTRNINNINAIDLVRANSQSIYNDALSSLFSGNDIPYSYYIIVKSDLDVGSAQVIIALENSGNSAQENIAKSSTNLLNAYREDDSFSSTSSPSGTFNTTNNYLMSVNFSGSEIKTYINGTNQNTYASNLGQITLNRFRVGGYKTVQFFDGIIGEIIVTDGTESTNDRQEIEGYLAHYWGLLSSLDSGHPYKTYPPLRGLFLFWNPSYLGTLMKAWYDATDSTTITESAGAVSQWNDKSVNGYNLIQPTGSNQPETNTRTINSLNIIDFDRASAESMYNDSLAQLYSGDDVSYSIYFVGIRDGNVLQDFICMERQSTSAPFNICRFDGSNRLVVSRRDDTTTFVISTYTTAIDANPHIFRCHQSASNVQMHLDGTSVFSGASNIGTQTLDRFRVGSFRGANALDGAIGELIVTDGTETTAQRELIEGYLAWKYALTANLPSNHPYKNNRPTT